MVAFLALTILIGTSHEFAHHFAGAAVCGEFGVKTFNSFELPPDCEENRWSLLATAAGPLFTFGIMWWGASLLRRQDPSQRQLGFALIFANFPINRLLFVLLYCPRWVEADTSSDVRNGWKADIASRRSQRLTIGGGF